jgi:hypothetical protein
MAKALTAFTLLLVLASSAFAQETAPPAPPATVESQAPAPAATATGAYSAYGERRSLLEDELRQLEAQRAELGLGGPIALMIVGGGAFVIGGLIVMVAVLSDAVCDDVYDSGDSCSGADDGIYVLGGVGMLGGGIAAILGLVMLIDRAGERRTLGVRIKEIRRELSHGPSFGLHFDSGRAGASIRLRF